MRKIGDTRIDTLRAFGQNVARLRRQRELSVDEFAARVNLDPGILMLAEMACHPELSLAAAVQIADALGVPFAALFEDPDDLPPPPPPPVS